MEKMPISTTNAISREYSIKSKAKYKKMILVDKQQGRIMLKNL